MSHNSVLDAPHAGQTAELLRPRPVERRDVASRQKLVRRIEMEWEEMPGLRLTVAQARRLFGLPEDVCVRVLNALLGAGILCRYGNGAYGCRRVQP